jgi:glycosyltransferase involved in cell wall biosynthesis
MGLEYYWRQRRAKSPGELTATHLWAGREFCRRILRCGLGDGQAVYTFNSAGLEVLTHARARGLLTVVEQTSAPAGIEDILLQVEQADHPAWESPRGDDSYRDEFQERERMEWEKADSIICGSEFVRDGIRASGGPVERCCIVPYGTRPIAVAPCRSFDRGPLRVLTVGTVRLHKGAPYVLAAARSLKGRVEFRMVGHIGVTRCARALLSRHVTLLGAVPQSEIQQHYEWADVFLLPSICEGSAAVCYEALATGLPVVTTPNAGSVVRDGTDGFIVPIRDAEAIVQKLELLVRDRKMLAWMSANAAARSGEFTLEKYGERLMGAVISAVRSAGRVVRAT